MNYVWTFQNLFIVVFIKDRNISKFNHLDKIKNIVSYYCRWAPEWLL
jgi:hypothetical protein